MYLCVILAPFLGSIFAGLFGRWIGARGSGIVAVFGLLVSALISVLIWHEVSLQGSSVYLSLGTWFEGGSVCVNWNFCFDPLTACMLLTVTVVSCCVHIYSIGYMQADPHLPRFLSYLSLFTGSMLLLVTASDLITLLVGWEMIGVSSFLLIGFWLHGLNPTKSALQAVQVNRISDTLLMIGLMASWWYVGSTDLYIIATTGIVSNYTDIICLLLLAGALGKSAQIGLHVWLPNAMAGPTPVSALIHAATLVTAGIYLIARTSGIWECSTTARTVLVFVGALTSFMAATLGLVQNDLKCVIAYSTCSQLGYMAVALGLSHYALAINHLMTHACFKALLFLGAGVAIHATADIQDLRRQGGAHHALPWAWTLLLLGSLSLVGWPFLAGYYSKDAILELAWATPGPTGSFSHLILMVVAGMTSAYSFRVLVAVFGAAPNARRLELSSPGVPYTMAVPLIVLAIGSIFAGYLFSDMLIGWGSPLWQHSMTIAPGTQYAIDSHMIPAWGAQLPLYSVIMGLFLAICFVWPLPLCAEAWNKGIYLFLQARWHFDNVWNQQIAFNVLSLGAQTWALIDKGILDLLGPRGVSETLYSQVVPAVQKWQTGTVHDYALVLQISVVIGLFGLVSFISPAPYSIVFGLILLFVAP
jgi:proton-translocating NADH-quinone oxidoreductase chain L